MSKDKANDHFRQDRVLDTPNRQGLVGATPVGNRWRAQGNIDGSIRYLGTFDTEEEAHEAYVAAKNAAQAVKEQEEADWLASAPEYVYEGGIGRGARLNGTRYKMVSDEMPEHLILRQIGDDGSIASDNVILNRRYLRLVEPEEETSKVVEKEVGLGETLNVSAVLPEEEKDAVLAALHAVEDIADAETLAKLPPEVARAILLARGLLTESTREAMEKVASHKAMKEEVNKLLFMERPTQGDKIERMDWLFPHLSEHGNAREAMLLINGKLDHESGLRFLKEHTDIPHSLLDELLNETVGKVFEREGDPSPELMRRMGWDSR